MINEHINTIAVIPARINSKRFPKKNISILNNRPLITYAISALKSSEKIDKIFVSTNSDEIANIATKNGAIIPYIRDEKLSGDDITIDQVVSDLILNLRYDKSPQIKNVIVIQPTSPFVQTEHINCCIDLLNNNNNFDSVATYSLLDHRHHPYNLSKISEDNKFEFIHEIQRKKNKTRQSKPNYYKFANLFVSRIPSFLKNGRFGNNKGGIIIDSIYSWDIDYDWELNIAEFIINSDIVKLNHLNIG